MKEQYTPRNCYKGPYNEQMELLTIDGASPFSILDLLKKRINTNKDKIARDFWWCNNLNSADGVAYHRNGVIKIVLDALPLMGITSRSRLYDGGLVLPNGMFERLNGVKISEEELEMYNALERPTKEYFEDGSHIIWNILKRNFSLKDIINHFYRNMNKQNMSVNIDPAPEEFPEGVSSIIKPLSIEIVDFGSSIYTGSLTDPEGILIGKFTSNGNLEARL